MMTMTDTILTHFSSLFKQRIDDPDGVPRPSPTRHHSSFSVTSSLPHVLRHGISAIDPRFESNRAFHRLSGRIRSTKIEHEAMAQQTKGMATSVYQWGQDQQSHNREDRAGDEALADVSDRLAYIVSLIGDLHLEHAQNVEDSRADLKRIQRLEMELAPRRAMRVKLHKELINLIPERALPHSEKIAPIEERLKALEEEDKPKEEELGKLKREALKSSFDSHFDSLIELGEKTALIARYGKLLLQQLPVYSPPFPAPRVSARLPDAQVWPHEARVAAVRAAVEPALRLYKADLSLPQLPSDDEAKSLSKGDTVKFAESNSRELESMLAHQDAGNHSLDTETMVEESSSMSFLDAPHVDRRRSSSSGALSPLPEGGSLPPNLNLEPAVLPERRPTLGSVDPAQPISPALPPRPVHGELQQTQQGEDSVDAAHSAAIGDSGPTYAETGSPIASSDPGPKSGTLNPRRPPSIFKPMPALPPELASPNAQTRANPMTGPGSSTVPTNAPSPSGTTASGKDQEALRERAEQERREVEELAVAARLRRDGTVVRRGDPDWEHAQKEDLPPYTEQ
jgi:hypothetical protein